VVGRAKDHPIAVFRKLEGMSKLEQVEGSAKRYSKAMLGAAVRVIDMETGEV